jgi:hypothetical protein
MPRNLSTRDVQTNEVRAEREREQKPATATKFLRVVHVPKVTL